MGSEPGNFREPHDLYVGGSEGSPNVIQRQFQMIALEPARAVLKQMSGRCPFLVGVPTPEK
jgi:hypothetical protein